MRLIAIYHAIAHCDMRLSALGAHSLTERRMVTSAMSIQPFDPLSVTGHPPSGGL